MPLIKIQLYKYYRNIFVSKISLKNNNETTLVMALLHVLVGR